MIQDGDRLVFAGVVATIVELQKIRGMRPVTEEETPAEPTPAQRLVEAVEFEGKVFRRDIGWREITRAGAS